MQFAFPRYRGRPNFGYCDQEATVSCIRPVLGGGQCLLFRADHEVYDRHRPDRRSPGGVHSAIDAHRFEVPNFCALLLQTTFLAIF
jgi:hypothetical protein